MASESVVLRYQIRAIDKQRLIKHYGALADKALQARVIAALEFQLGIK